jgi:hypothetical protein
MATRPRGEGVDEEFLHALYRGGELLAAGKVIEAKDHLERAFQLQPRNEKGQNLLGLTYFKLGLFDRAAEIYEMLVRDNPADPTLRINLGLVYLKTSALQRAVREFEVATDLQPEHTKSHNYLGLALAQAGEYGRAREHFLLAGSDAMAQKMERALEAPPSNGAAHAAVEAPDQEPFAEESPPEPAPTVQVTAEVQIDLMSEDQVPQEGPPPPMGEVSWGDQFGLDGEPVEPKPQPEPLPEVLGRPGAVAEAPPLPDAQPILVAEEAEPPPAEEPPPAFEMAEPPPPAEKPAPAPEPVSTDADPQPLTLAQLAPQLLLHPKQDRSFVVDGETVILHVRDELLTRLSGLMGFTGRLEFVPEMKRFRGRSTDKAFGEAEARMTRVRGVGLIAVNAGGRLFVPLDLGEDSAYFREDVVFAFEEPVMFENGRVPSEVPPDLDLVHLRGAGRALLALPGPLKSLEVKMDQPVTLPLTQLAGWHGNLTPRMVSLGWDAKGKPARAGVELTGEGFALLSLPVG